MKIFIGSLVLIGLISCRTNDPSGIYSAAEAGFSSVLELKKDGKFKYTFYRDSFCNGEVQGRYSVARSIVKFENDFEYTEASHEQFVDSLNKSHDPSDTISYDVGFADFDMDKVNWKIKAHSIQPLMKVQTNCIEVDSRHLKQLRVNLPR